MNVQLTLWQRAGLALICTPAACALLLLAGCGSSGGTGDPAPVSLNSPEMAVQRIMSINSNATFVATVTGAAVDAGAPPLVYTWRVQEERGVLGTTGDVTLVTQEPMVAFEARALGVERVTVDVSTSPSQGPGALVGKASFDFEITSGGVEICVNSEPLLLFRFGSDIWQSDLDGRNRYVIANGFLGGALSPDGQRLALAEYESFTRNYVVYVADCDGGSVRRLTQSSADDSYGGATWSPDSTYLVVQHVSPEDATTFPFRTASLELSFVDAETGTVTRWTDRDDEFSYQGGSSFSPDGTELVTIRADVTNFPDMAVIVRNLNSGGERVLVSLVGNGLGASAPDWSPGGDMIAYDGHRGSGTSDFEEGIYVVPASGGTPKLIFEGSASGPRWIEGGAAIVFTMVGDPEGDPGNFDLWRIEADGSGLQQLTFTPESEGPPTVFNPR